MVVNRVITMSFLTCLFTLMTAIFPPRGRISEDIFMNVPSPAPSIRVTSLKSNTSLGDEVCLVSVSSTVSKTFLIPGEIILPLSLKITISSFSDTVIITVYMPPMLLIVCVVSEFSNYWITCFSQFYHVLNLHCPHPPLSRG